MRCRRDSSPITHVVRGEWRRLRLCNLARDVKKVRRIVGGGFSIEGGAQVGGKRLKDFANHGLLLVAGVPAEFNKFGGARRDGFTGNAVESNAHHTERLGEIMNDAMEEDFLFLNFAQEFLVFERGAASGLQNLDALLILRPGGVNGEDRAVFQKQRRSLQGDFRAGGRLFDPDAGTVPQKSTASERKFSKNGDFSARDTDC